MAMKGVDLKWYGFFLSYKLRRFNYTATYLSLIRSLNPHDPLWILGAGRSKKMAQTTVRSGRVVGDSLVGRQIGSGSLSVVWEAMHRVHGTQVAIKEIAMGRLNKKLQDSLMSEIFILMRINHPNIIRLLDMIEEVICLCISSVMEVSLKLRFEASDDPLEKITTTEAIRLLVDYYHTSDYYTLQRLRLKRYLNIKGLFLIPEAARLVSFSRPTR